MKEEEIKEIGEALLKEHPIDEMVKFSELDIQDKLRENDFYVVKYRDIYHEELAKLDRLNDLIEKLIGIRYKFYRFEDNHEWTKPEIEKFCIPSDRKVLQAKELIRKQEIRVRFFEMAWKAFEKQSWNMKMFLETLKGY